MCSRYCVCAVVLRLSDRPQTGLPVLHRQDCLCHGAASSREIAVNILAIQAPNEWDLILGRRDPDAVVSKLDSVVVSLRLKLLDVGNGSQTGSGLDALDQLRDGVENRLALDGFQIFAKLLLNAVLTDSAAAA